MPVKLPEISENHGETVKYHDYTDTKNYCGLKTDFFADR